MVTLIIISLGIIASILWCCICEAARDKRIQYNENELYRYYALLLAGVVAIMIFTFYIDQESRIDYNEQREFTESK